MTADHDFKTRSSYIIRTKQFLRDDLLVSFFSWVPGKTCCIKNLTMVGSQILAPLAMQFRINKMYYTLGQHEITMWLETRLIYSANVIYFMWIFAWRWPKYGSKHASAVFI